MEPENNKMEMELWSTIKEANSNNTDEVRKLMRSYGYTSGEVDNFLGAKKKSKAKGIVEEIKEELYLRHKLRLRLLDEHKRDANLLVTLDAERQEEQHLIESLTKLGEIAPVGQGNNGIQQLLGIEQLIIKSYSDEQKQIPKLEEVITDKGDE